MKDFFSKCNQILNGKLHFLCRDILNRSCITVLKTNPNLNASTSLRTSKYNA